MAQEPPGLCAGGHGGHPLPGEHPSAGAGDELYLYTDGVTEATNSSQELFGEERLQAALNEEPDLPVHKLLPKIKGCIDAFVGEAEQFDDITMLGLHYMERGEKSDG